MERNMKKFFIAIMSVMLMSTLLYSADKSAKQYIADLDPAKDEAVIVTAADWCGKEKEKGAITSLTALCTDSREAVRLHAVMALGYIGKEDAVDALNKRLLTDESAEVRYAAVLATVRIGSKKSLEAWKEAKEKENDPFIKDFLVKMEEKARGK